MANSFEKLLRSSENRVGRLRKKVDSGESRLVEPKRLTKQIEDTGDTINRLFIIDAIHRTPPKREDAEPEISRWIAWVQFLWNRVAGRFLARFFQTGEEKREDLYTISVNVQLQNSWERRYDKMSDDSEELDEATTATQARCQATQEDIDRVKGQLQTAREVEYLGPPIKRRRRSLWERVWRALKARQLSVYFEKEEAKETKHVDRMEKILDEAIPNLRELEQNVSLAAEFVDQCQAMLNETKRLATPNHSGSNRTDA